MFARTESMATKGNMLVESPSFRSITNPSSFNELSCQKRVTVNVSTSAVKFVGAFIRTRGTFPSSAPR